MKKWFATILIFITAAAAFAPCCAIDDCAADKMASSDHDKDDKQEGNCSPFFSCATCQGSIDLPKTVSITAPVVLNSEYHETLTVFRPSTYIASFWQPPRS